MIEKAQLIADEWGLKNPRVALEAVFRKYADEYMYGRVSGGSLAVAGPPVTAAAVPEMSVAISPVPRTQATTKISAPGCEAIDALDDLLAM
ncbi:MAG: hypothetical protein AAFU71_12555 [Cyanobacteria bacterium J06632_22]